MSSHPSYFSMTRHWKEGLHVSTDTAGYCISLWSAPQMTEGPEAEAFVSLLLTKVVRSLVWNMNTSLQRATGSPVRLLRFLSGVMMTRETFQLHIWESASNLAASPCGCSPFLFPSAALSPRLHSPQLLLPHLSEAQARLPYTRASLRTQWWTVFICCDTSWLAGNDVNYMRCFIRRDRRCHILC